MIAYIEGLVVGAQLGKAIVLAGGIGYEILVKEELLVGSKAQLWIESLYHEGHPTLFGFSHMREKQWFLKCIKVQGIGGKMVMQLLSSLSLNGMVNAIRQSQSEVLQRCPGVGKKLAERMITELKPQAEEWYIPHGEKEEGSTLQEELRAALLALGYDRTALEKALAAVVQQTTTLSFSEGLPICLDYLSKGMGNL